MSVSPLILDKTREFNARLDKECPKGTHKEKTNLLAVYWGEFFASVVDSKICLENNYILLYEATKAEIHEWENPLHNIYLALWHRGIEWDRWKNQNPERYPQGFVDEKVDCYYQQLVCLAKILEELKAN